MRITKDKCQIVVEPVEGNRLKIQVFPENRKIFIPITECITSYPIDLVELILNVKGPYGICDEIYRDEHANYVQISLKYDILSYVNEKAFAGKRILDFGCGSGASTSILGRMFPQSQIVGVEMGAELLKIAEARAAYYKLANVTFEHSADPSCLPSELGAFDFILLSAVFEHLLPRERHSLFPKIWSFLKPEGVLFINQTPYRYFPVETHTTGLPFINYLPDKLACFYAQKCSKRNLEKADWPELLRRGIRGCSVREIMKILSGNPQKAMLLNPSHMGIRDRVDLWHVKMDRSKHAKIKELYGIVARLLSYSGIVMLPHISIALQKQSAGR